MIKRLAQSINEDAPVYILFIALGGIIFLPLGGLLFEAGHHGKNKSKWTDINGLVSLGNEVLLKRTKLGVKPPDIILRGHYHWSGHTPYDMRPYVASIPSWQVWSDFVYRIDATADHPIVGGHCMAVNNGEIEKVKRFTYTYPRSSAWKPK